MPTDEASEATMQLTAPGYDLDDYVEASTPQQLKAIGHPTRSAILDLVMERAATTTELASALGIPKGTVGYHLDVLEDAGLVRVVATRKVRALTARYYGRTGRTIVIKGDYLGGGHAAPMLAEALEEATEAVNAGALTRDDPVAMFTLRHVRLSVDRAATFARRLDELTVEFTAQPRGGDVVYGLIAGIYPTTRPVLRDDPEEER